MPWIEYDHDGPLTYKDVFEVLDAMHTNAMDRNGEDHPLTDEVAALLTTFTDALHSKEQPI